MNILKEYREMHARIQLLREIGHEIDNSDLPLMEKMKLTDPLSHTVYALNVWLMQNRHLAENELQNRFVTDNHEA